MLLYLLLTYFFNSAILTSSAENVLLTQTVYGFLDFTTTIGNTVMVFSPQSAPPIDQEINSTSTQVNIIETKPLLSKTQKAKEGIKPTKSSIVPSIPFLNKQSEVNNGETLNISSSNTPIENVVSVHEYDLLSRQPEEYAEETYRLVNLKPKTGQQGQKKLYSSRDNLHPTGLVTKISGTYTKNGQSTIRETSVLGTYISGKYAQILQSTSVVQGERRNKPRPSSTVRSLKSTTSSIHIYPSQTQRETTASQHYAYNKSNRKTSSNNREPTEKSKPASSTRKSSRNKGKRRNKIGSTSSVSPSIVDTSNRRPYRTKNVNTVLESESTASQYTLKLNRRPGRWQYKSSPKPRINIRKHSNATISPEQNNGFNITETVTEVNEDNQIQKFIGTGKDLEASGSQNGGITSNDDEIKPRNFLQTLNVEISTPKDFVDTYYEIATLISPFVFQAGVVKKTRFVTVTSTIEKILTDEHTEEYSIDDGPLTENILESTPTATYVSLDGSISTLSPILITDGSETPNLESITESFSITQTRLKTQILPVIFQKENATSLITLVQTYDYTSLITVTRTISPLSDDFVLSKNFKDFEGNLDEAGSELNLDLDFGDEDNAGHFDKKVKPSSKIREILTSSTNSLNNQETTQSQAVNLLSPSNTHSVITSTSPVVKLETIWESHVVPLMKGTETIFRTLSKSVGVVEKTEYVTQLSTIAVPLPATQFPFSINPFYNPLLPIPQQQLITTTEVLQTTVTQTDSKILKLTFGARTAYTTIYSTAVLPTTVTKLVTTAFPIQQSGSFPNYYPPPYPQFAFVG